MDVSYSENVYSATIDSEEASNLEGIPLEAILERDIDDEIIFKLSVNDMIGCDHDLKFLPKGRNYTTCDRIEVILSERHYGQLLHNETYSFETSHGKVEIDIDDDLSMEDF